jgi:hypothetical protein
MTDSSLVPTPSSIESSRRRLAQFRAELGALRVREAELEAEIGTHVDYLAAARGKESTSQHRQLAYRLPRVAQMLDVSLTVVKREIARGVLKSDHIGGCRVVLAGEIDAYPANLPEHRE